MRKFLTVIFTFIVFTYNFSAFAQDESRLSKTWEVQKYNINAALPQNENDRYLTVKAGLNLKNVSSAAANRLTLRISSAAEISAVKVNDAAADFSKGEEKIGGNRSLQRIIVRVPSTTVNSNLVVVIDYKLKVDENTGLNALSPIGSQFLPLSFWYPTPNSWYFPRGADYAPFSLTVTGNQGVVLSSGAKRSKDLLFEQKLNSQPFFVVGNWETVNSNNVFVYVPKESDAEAQKRATELANLASDAKNFTTDLLGSAPDDPINIVAVKNGAGFSSGGTVFVEESVFRRQKIDAQTAMSIAEAIAKLWIGNLATVSGDGYGAIKEGLPRFIATQFLEKQYGKDIAEIERLRQRTSYVAIVQRDAPLNVVSPLDDYFYTVVANKGAMIWRLLANRTGQNEFFNVIKSKLKNRNLVLADLRSAFPSQKTLLDYSFDSITDGNLLIGLPQATGAETKVALRNTGSLDSTVNISAITANGEKLTSQTTIAAKSFAEASFKNSNKIIRVEVDPDKFYPQTDYTDDVAPKVIDTNDPILFIKRAFDQQNFVQAEKNAGLVLSELPHLDDARTWLGRSFLAQGKISDAEKEFRAVLDEKLPAARNLAWSNAGLGEIALRNGQNTTAVNFFNETIKADAEYGATITARQARNRLNLNGTIDESVKSYFTQFDKVAVAGRKAELDAMILPGEILKFSSGIAGQAEQWQTNIISVDKINSNSISVGANLNIKLLNRNAESGLVVYRLTKIGNYWKLSGVEVFEVR